MKKKIVIVLIFVLLLLPSIPIMDASNNQIVTNNEDDLKIKDNLEKNIIITIRQKSNSDSEDKNLSFIVSSGAGRAYFIPPRLGRKKFFCCAAIVIYTSIFSATRIKNETYAGPQIFIFLGIARVWYKRHPILRDDISIFGMGFGKVLFSIF